MIFFRLSRTTFLYVNHFNIHANPVVINGAIGTRSRLSDSLERTRIYSLKSALVMAHGALVALYAPDA